MNSFELLLFVVPFTVVASLLYRRKQQEPARLNEVINGLKLLHYEAKSRNNFDRVVALDPIVKALEEIRSLETYRDLKPTLPADQVYRSLLLALDFLELLYMPQDNRRLCRIALGNYADRFRKRYFGSR